MSEIEISREHRAWMDRGRAYIVIVNGNEVGEVVDAGTTRIDILPGTHTVALKVDWARSRILEVQVRPGERRRLICWPNAKPWNVLYFASVGRKNWIGLRVDDVLLDDPG